MNTVASRLFEVRPAVREAVGLLISLVGPSGGGKTFSALRLASGIQRVVGGDIDLIDTENGRALFYADRFKFNHLRFAAPFSPTDYLEAVRHCAKRGAKTIIVDSMSHEHDGPGGVLEMHESELTRLAGDDFAKRERVKMLAWNKPKTQRKRLIQELLQLNVNLILTYRAKQKLKIQKGKDPIELGWQPICGEEFMYEMTVQCLLPPGANGMPRWTSDFEGERAITKLPEQFKTLFVGAEGEVARLTEDLGEQLAQWAVGTVRKSSRDQEIDVLIGEFARCTSADELKRLEKRREKLWTKATPVAQKDRMREAAEAARARLKVAAVKPPDAETWMNTLAGQTTLAALEDAWHECLVAFNDNPPDECDAAYQTRREVLGEAEGRQLNL